MKEAILRVVYENEEDGYPKNSFDARELNKGILKSRIRRLSTVGFDDLIFFSEDAYMHNDIYELYDYAMRCGFDKVSIVTSGSWLQTEHFRKVHVENIQLIVPIDLCNPFDDEILGYRNYERSIDRVIRRIPDNTTVWSTPNKDNVGMLRNLKESGINVCVVIPHKDSKIGIELPVLRQIVDEKTPVYDMKRWILLHYKINDVKKYANVHAKDIYERSQDYTGTIYVDKNGKIRTHRDVSKDPIIDVGMSSRRQLQKLCDEVKRENMRQKCPNCNTTLESGICVICGHEEDIETKQKMQEKGVQTDAQEQETVEDSGKDAQSSTNVTVEKPEQKNGISFVVMDEEIDAYPGKALGSEFKKILQNKGIKDHILDVIDDRHIEVVKDDEDYYIKDMSKSTTKVNGEIVSNETRIRDGDKIELGDVVTITVSS